MTMGRHGKNSKHSRQIFKRAWACGCSANIDWRINRAATPSRALTGRQHLYRPSKILLRIVAATAWNKVYWEQAEQTLANDQQRLNILNVELGRFAAYQQALQAQKQQAQMRIEGLPAKRTAHRTVAIAWGTQDDCKQQREQIAKNLVALNKQKARREKNLAVEWKRPQTPCQPTAPTTTPKRTPNKAVLAWQTAKAAFDQQFAAFDDNELDTQMTRLRDDWTSWSQYHRPSRIYRWPNRWSWQQPVSIAKAEQQYQAWQTEQATLQNLLAQQEVCPWPSYPPVTQSRTY